MKKNRSKILICLSKEAKSFYVFLKENGFFEEIVRGIVKLVFFIIVLYYFGQVIW